jgi:hypothetical protein
MIYVWRGEGKPNTFVTILELSAPRPGALFWEIYLALVTFLSIKENARLAEKNILDIKHMLHFYL